METNETHDAWRERAQGTFIMNGESHGHTRVHCSAVTGPVVGSGEPHSPTTSWVVQVQRAGPVRRAGASSCERTTQSEAAEQEVTQS